VRDVIVTYRRVLVVAMHLLLWTASFVGAFLLRFDFNVPATYWNQIPVWLAELVALSIGTYFRFGLFHGLWRYSGARDLLSLLKAATAATVLFAALVTFIGPHGLPRSIFIITWLMTVMVVGGLRFGIRIVREVAVRNAAKDADTTRRRVLVVGAGDAGEMLMREIVRAHSHRYEPVGFVDDNPVKIGERIHGVPVLGPISMVSEIVEREGVDEIVVAIPSISGRQMRRILDMCDGRDVQTRMLPAVDRLIDGRVTVSQLQAVHIEDLLGREPIVLDTEAISAFVRGRTVLVTGAGGSIGSELCRQISRFHPARLVLVEQAENNLYHIHRDLMRLFPSEKIVPLIADICDSRRLRGVFEREQPHVVFHAAAHKHVPMMEWNPGEALKNNVFGTKKLAELSATFGVDKFVMVSTDKAVNPTSVMGASKRAAEVYVQMLSQRSATQFVTVRFGNVLGSEGSVVPLFKEQIARGGPVTVTHPEMKRYFMTIPEACQLVLQAGAMGAGGEIFILDMGEPVKIVDLARDLIRLSGLVPGEDIEIQFTGVRPGEKLFEELSMSDENADKTVHPKIYVGKFKPYPWSEVERHFETLHRLTDATDPDEIRAGLAALVTEYRPSPLAPPSTVLPAMPQGQPEAVGGLLGRPASVSGSA
jgi:FlaA1/EpsC-like NDP-sugar epimerase